MSLSASRLLIRADATRAIGAGHVMRTLVLADAWTSALAGPAAVVGTFDLPFVRRRLLGSGIPIHERLPADGETSVLVVDSYDESVRQEGGAWRAATLRVLVDDLGGAVPGGYDVVWNPGPLETGHLYPGFRGVHFGGEGWVPVRAGLPSWSGGEQGRVAVLLGGSGVSPALTAAMSVLGETLPATRFSGAGDWVPGSWDRLDADEPWAGIIRSSVLVTAAGTTLLEAANTGIPVVALCTADNQTGLCDWARGGDVPVIDIRDIADGATVPGLVAAALPTARPLPRLENGAPALVEGLLALAAKRGTAT